MKRVMVIVAMVFIVCLVPARAFSEQLAPRPKGEGEWGLHDKTGALVGAVKKTEEGGFKFYDGEGEYVGLILESGIWIPKDARRSYTRIKPEEAEFYLNVLNAIKTIK